MRTGNPLKKLLLAALVCVPLLSLAQKKDKPLPNWQNLDLKTDGQFGMSTEKAYNELLKGKPHVPVTVAVVDGGVDVTHEDLKSVLWLNAAEIANNKQDDDKNGYIDDIYGWNFLGSAKGTVHYDNLELTRLLRRDMQQYKYANPDNLKGDELAKYQKYQDMDAKLNRKLAEALKNADNILQFATYLGKFLKELNNENPTREQVEHFYPSSPIFGEVKRVLLENWTSGSFEDFKKEELEEPYENTQDQIKYHLNLDFDSRDTVADNYNNSAERLYGNNDVAGPDADHGTHVAGIIGAARDNNLGIKGVADDVRIMVVRTVPNGDERDKDVANSIRYAAANGAKVLNMSFGKSYSYDKKAVDEAVKYAMSKDVLLVHAAGNDSQDNDKEPNFPTRKYEGGGMAEAWIEVGASGFKDDNELKASFSNYGKTSVDVFAPGVKIYSCAPGSKYRTHDGTSMAAPAVTGLAALIRSYYPKLTAVQVKDIIMKSVVKVDHKVKVKNEKGSSRSMAFADLCISGGIVNAYEALKLAAAY